MWWSVLDWPARTAGNVSVCDKIGLRLQFSHTINRLRFSHTINMTNVKLYMKSETENLWSGDMMFGAFSFTFCVCQSTASHLKYAFAWPPFEMQREVSGYESLRSVHQKLALCYLWTVVSMLMYLLKHFWFVCRSTMKRTFSCTLPTVTRVCMETRPYLSRRRLSSPFNQSGLHEG